MVRYYLMNDNKIIAETENHDTARQMYYVAFDCGFYTSGAFNIVLVVWNSCKDNYDELSASFKDGKLVSYQN